MGPDEDTSRSAESRHATIASFDKGLRILEHIVHAEAPVRQYEIASRFDMDKSSVLRFLNTLSQLGLVERDPTHKTYRPGATLSIWASHLRASNLLVTRARPFLRSLALKTGQTAHLAVLRDDGVVLLEVMPSGHAVSVRQTPGDWEPLYCSSVGKAILALLPPAEQQLAISRIKFRELTPNTLSAPYMLRAELQSVLTERVAFDDAENNPEVSCIGAPVVDRYGYPVASLGISFLNSQYPKGPRVLRGFIDEVKASAEALGAALMQATLD